MKTTNVRTMRQDELQSAIATIVTAFSVDPVVRWIFREPALYLKAFPDGARFFAGKAFEHDTAYCTEDYMGVALWLPPGVKPDNENLGALMEEHLPEDRLTDVATLMEKMDTFHPHEPHWYLPMMG